MAVMLIGAIQRFVGVASDTKPASPPAGSTFRETDTLDLYIFDGSAWQLRLEP